MNTNNLTSEQTSYLLSNLIGDNTYQVCDESSNRFNFYGITEDISEEYIKELKKNDIKIYPLSNIENDLVSRAVSVFEQNDVNMSNFSYILSATNDVYVTYLLLWGEITYDVHFNDENSSNNKGFKCTIDECMSYLQQHNGTNHSYFADYKNGSVSVICNETGEIAFETEIKTAVSNEVKGFSFATIYETASSYLIDLRTGLGEATYPKDQFSVEEAIADQVCSVIE